MKQMVDLGDIPGIQIDPRYAGCNNLIGRPLAGYIAPKVMGSPALRDALAKLQAGLTRKGYQLLLYDGYRPQKAVDDLIRWCQLPEDGLTKSAYYPSTERRQLIPMGYIAERSSHSRGSAIDLTLLNQRNPLDMGILFDLMDPLSEHGAEGITLLQSENRHRLKCWMEEAGFEAYHREWWHYRLIDEPYPDTCFDEDIE